MTAKVVVEEGKKRRVIELPAKTRLTIGRASTNAIVIEDIAASREHAALELRVDRWYVSDLESKNGTLLNGEKITKAAIRAWKLPSSQVRRTPNGSSDGKMKAAKASMLLV